MPGEFKEEYLEAIYELTEDGKDAAKTIDIAKKLSLKPGSVTEMLRKLSTEGYVQYKPYYGAKLTAKGLSEATRLKRKHRLLERFLHDMLGFHKSRVHKEACRMEHSLSDRTANALDRLLGHPKTCPDDNKSIPRPGQRKQAKNALDMAAGVKYRVIRLDSGKGLESNLRAIGIREGSVVSLVARQPARGPLVLKAGNTTVTVGRGMASKIIVKEK